MKLDQVLLFLELYKYWLLYPFVIIEGPIITIIAGFLASIGVLNLYFVIPVAIAGDLTGDVLYYMLGRLGRVRFINKWGHYIGVTKARIEAADVRFRDHTGRMLFFGKFAYGFETLTIIAAGITRVPFLRFLSFVLAPSVLKYSALAIVGYFFGSAYVAIAKYLDDLVLAVGLVIILAVLAFFGYRFMIKKLAKKI